MWQVSTSLLLDSVVRLRLALSDTRDPALRRELREIEVPLRRELGPSIPKSAAARLLGISVTALDRWIDRGVLPTVAATATSKRLAVEAAPLLELAVEVRRLRRAGHVRGVIAAAVRSLGWRASGKRIVLSLDLARLPRPNVPVAELQRHFAETTPEERILEVSALNRSLNVLSGRAPA